VAKGLCNVKLGTLYAQADGVNCPEMQGENATRKSFKIAIPDHPMFKNGYSAISPFDALIKSETKKPGIVRRVSVGLADRRSLATARLQRKVVLHVLQFFQGQ
jgi:hypothetical protein